MDEKTKGGISCREHHPDECSCICCEEFHQLTSTKDIFIKLNLSSELQFLVKPLDGIVITVIRRIVSWGKKCSICGIDETAFYLLSGKIVVYGDKVRDYYEYGNS